MSVDQSRMDQFEVSGLGALADRYDVFVLDQYGVLHNGGKLLPGCADTLRRLHEMGKKLIILSNTSKRRQSLVDELPGRGFEAEWLYGAICSGEVCHEALRGYDGQKAVVLGWSTRSSAEYLTGTGVELANLDDANILVAYGPDVISTRDGDIDTGFMRSGDLGPYRETLERAADAGLLMLCANPDQRSLHSDGTTLLYMPGTLADAYAALGGEVIAYGKPGVAHFNEAIRLAGVTDTSRVIHVGDSLKHDIAGAHATGIDSLFVVESGVHAEAICADVDWPRDPRAAVERLATKFDSPMPTFAAAKFVWGDTQT
jgi:HAD superfamily hydrolase (TIGR01459 family)